MLEHWRCLLAVLYGMRNHNLNQMYCINTFLGRYFIRYDSPSHAKRYQVVSSDGHVYFNLWTSAERAAESDDKGSYRHRGDNHPAQNHPL